MVNHDAMITIERRLAARHPDLRVVALTVTGVTVERTSADMEELRDAPVRQVRSKIFSSNDL
ncbi:MAG: hypothetical protein V3V21_05035 [Thermoplasmata archaeon]